MYCCKTAQTAMSEASVMIFMGASGFGCERSVAVASASLMATNAVRASSFNCTVFVLSLDETRRSFRGCSMSAQPGIKRW